MACATALPLAGALLLGTAAAIAPARAQDAAAGQRAYTPCRACHTIEQGGRNNVGPNLHGVVGRKAGSVEGFRYSPAMRQKGEEGLVWTEETLRPFLRNPREAVPGTAMSFPGLKDEQRLNDLIGYLKQNSG